MANTNAVADCRILQVWRQFKHASKDLLTGPSSITIRVKKVTTKISHKFKPTNIFRTYSNLPTRHQL